MGAGEKFRPRRNAVVVRVTGRIVNTGKMFPKIGEAVLVHVRGRSQGGAERCVDGRVRRVVLR